MHVQYHKSIFFFKKKKKAFSSDVKQFTVFFYEQELLKHT